MEKLVNTINKLNYNNNSPKNYTTPIKNNGKKYDNNNLEQQKSRRFDFPSILFNGDGTTVPTFRKLCFDNSENTTNLDNTIESKPKYAMPDKQIFLDIFSQNHKSRPCTPYNYGKDNKDQTKLQVAFHHGININKTADIFSKIYLSDEISIEKKRNLTWLIKIKLSNYKHIIHEYTKYDSALNKLVEAFNPDKIDANILNHEDKELLKRIFSYFYGIGYAGPDEQYRIKELKAANNFDGQIKYLVNREKYELIKQLDAAKMANEQFELIFKLALIKPESYKEYKWIINNSHNSIKSYPHQLASQHDQYFKLTNEVMELEESIKSNKLNTQMKGKLFTETKNKISALKIFNPTQLKKLTEKTFMAFEAEHKRMPESQKFQEICDEYITKLEIIESNSTYKNAAQEISKLQNKMDSIKKELNNFKYFIMKTPEK